jgi:chorismate-pyruvate lyase
MARTTRVRRLAGVALMLAMSACLAQADTAVPAWPDDFTGRLEVLALLETLNADLLSNDSATLTLDRWCESHGLGATAKVVAERVGAVDKVPTAAQRSILKVDAADPVRYRRVRLRCGSRILSEADNWYVPARLTPEMNRQLDQTDIAFGRAVQALHFVRHTLAARLLWSPLPAEWESGAAVPHARPQSLAMPPYLLEHQAVLSLPDGTPFSLVVETYTREVLGFAPPPR